MTVQDVVLVRSQFSYRQDSKFHVSMPKKIIQQRCFKCNDVGHLLKSYPNCSCGLKCLACNTFSHKSMDCHHTTPNLIYFKNLVS